MMLLNPENLNFRLFELLNASGNPSKNALFLAVAAADYAIYLLPVILALLWLRGDPKKRGALVATFVGAEFGLGINQLVSLLWFHPRPFMVPVGHTLIPHVADSSFPSDHVTFMLAIAIGLWWFAAMRIAAAASAVLALAVAWSRIYLGVHFPFDMVGAIGTALAGMILAASLKDPIEGPLLNRFLLPVYRKAFAWPIGRGWCQY